MLVCVTLIAMAALVWREQPIALYGTAASSLALLFTGIHKAWIIAMRMTVERNRDKR